MVLGERSRFASFNALLRCKGNRVTLKRKIGALFQISPVEPLRPRYFAFIKRWTDAVGVPAVEISPERAIIRIVGTQMQQDVLEICFLKIHFDRTQLRAG